MADPLLALGVDGGGTKTDAVVCDTTGAVRGFGTSGRGNWEYDGIEVATASLGEAVQLALAEAGATPEQMASSVFALAGLDWPVDLERLAPVVDSSAWAGRSSSSTTPSRRCAPAVGTSTASSPSPAPAR